MNEYFKTLKFIFSQMSILLIIVGGPIAYPLIIGGVYLHGRTSEVQTMVFDMDKSNLSREYIQMLNQADGINVCAQANNMLEVKNAFENHKIYFAVVIPKNFQRDIKHSTQTNIMVYGDGVNLVPSIIAYKAIRTVTTTLGVGVKISTMEASGIGRERAYSKALPISADLIPLYNSTFDYNTFILPAILCVVFMQVIFMGVCAIAFDRRDNNHLPTKDTNPTKWFIGEFLAYFTLMMPMTIITFFFSQAIFKFPIIANILPYICTTIIFTSIIILLGIFLVTTFKDTVGIMICLMYISVPLFMVGGGSWPLEAMPSMVRKLTYISPLTLYTVTTKTVLTMGSDAYYARAYILGLLAWLVFAFVISYLSTLKFFDKEIKN